MSKNTQISELINYISVNESGNVVFTTVPAATTNTDKFLVSDSGVLKFRTAAQLLSDIGAQASLTNPVTGTGSAGQLAYWSSGSAITGEANLFWDETNNRLGIGTATPDRLVTIAATTPILSLLASSGSLAQIIFGDSASDTQGKIVYSNIDDSLQITVNAVERWRITNTGVLQSNGLQTIQTSTGNLTIATGGGNGNIILTPNGTGTTTINSSVTATQYTATSTGGSGLRVYGAAGTNQWDIYLNSTNLRFSDNTGTGSVVFDRPISGTSATFSSTGSFGNASLNGAYLVVKGANGVPASSGTTTTAVFRVSSGTGLYNVLDFGTNESDDYSWIQSTRANSLGTYDRLLIQPNGGAVRIGGTGVTSYKLLVDGTLGITGAATFSSSVTAGGDILANGSSIYTKAASGGYQISLNAQASPMKLRFDDLTGAAYGSMSFQAGNGTGGFVDRLTISSSGAATFSNNLTLSNANSTTDLGGVLIVRGNGSAYSTHYFTTGAVNVAAYYQYDAAGVIKNVIHSGANSYITGGNFGIGTSSPLTKLTVNNAVSGAILPYINGTGLSYNNDGISVAGSNTNNTNIGNGLTLYNNVASVGAYGPVISWSSMTVGGTYNATYAFITGVYRGAGGDNNWSKGDIIFGTGSSYGATERMAIKENGQIITYNGQTGGYVRRDSGFVNETATITENCTAYFLYKYTGTSNGSSSTIFNITGLSTTNGTWVDINLRVRKDATASGINTVAYIYINGQDMIGGVFASGTGAVQTNRTIRVVRMSDEWIIIGGVGSY